MHSGSDRIGVGLRLLLATAGFLLALGALLLWLAARMAPPGDATRGAAVSLAAETATVVMGQSRVADGELILSELSPAGEAFVVWSLKSLTAASYPVLELAAEDFPLNHVLMLAWRIDGEPEARFARLQPPTDAVQTTILSQFPEWRGQIVELALYLHPQPQTAAPLPITEPVTIKSMRLSPDRAPARIAALFDQWLSPDPWAMMSISSLGIYRDLQESTRLLPVIAIATALAWLLYSWALRLRGGRAWLRSLLLTAAVAIAATHLLWLIKLYTQRAATDAVYAGLSVERKDDRLFDAPLVDLVDRVRQQLPEPGTARIMTAADDRFFRLRMAWHLRPHNVLSFLPGENIAGVHAIVPGDYIFAYRRPDLAALAASGSLQLRGRSLPVRPLLLKEDAALLLVLGPAGDRAE